VGLPEALYVTAKSLPLLSILLRSLETSLGESEETKERGEKYEATYQFAELCQQQAKYLEAILKAVATDDTSVTAHEKYSTAVGENGEVAVEGIMKTLLKRAISLADTQLADDDLKSRLQIAFEEVDKLKPSLDEDSKGNVSIKNFGAGNQFYHGGRGHQNHCSGGIQITGNGATNHMMLPTNGR
jgi:hypothetical protein